MGDLFQSINWLSVLWLTIWFVLSTIVTIINKIIMNFGFNYPFTLSFMHMALISIIQFVESMFKCKETEEIINYETEKEIFIRIMFLSIIFTANLIFGNLSISHCSVSFVQIVRATNPIFTLLLSKVFLPINYTMHQIVACVIVCIGVILTCFGDLNFTWLGGSIVLVGTALSSAKTIATKSMLSYYDVKPLEIIRQISPISAIESFFVITCSKEVSKLTISGEFPKKDGTNNYVRQALFSNEGTVEPQKNEGLLVVMIIASCVAAFSLNLANFKATAYSSPLAFKIVGCVKQVLTVAFAVIFLEKNITPLNWLGIVVALIGSSYFSLSGICFSKPSFDQVDNNTIESASDLEVIVYSNSEEESINT